MSCGSRVKGYLEGEKMKLNINIECGVVTCAYEKGKFCRFLGSKKLGQVPVCMLFPDENGSHTILKTSDGWVQRCKACLAAQNIPFINVVTTYRMEKAYAISYLSEHLEDLIALEDKALFKIIVKIKRRSTLTDNQIIYALQALKTKGITIG